MARLIAYEYAGSLTKLSGIHPGAKLLSLICLSASIGISSPFALVPYSIFIPVLYIICGFKPIDLAMGARPIIPYALFMGILGTLQLPFSWESLMDRAPSAFLGSAKLLAIASVANLFYLSTATGEIADFFEGPPGRHGVLKSFGLTLGLALCYIPRLHALMVEINSAIEARLGTKGRIARFKDLLRALLPRALDMVDAYADALEARAYSRLRRPRVRAISVQELSVTMAIGAASLVWTIIM